MRRHVKTPPKFVILALADELSFADAADLIGVHERTFSKWYHHALPDIEHRSGPRPIEPPPKRKLLAILRTHSNQETADYFSVGYKTLARWLREYEIEDRLFDQDEMISLAEAARTMNVSRMAMSNWFRAGLIPGARKLNGTRVMVPASSLQTLQLWRNQNDGEPVYNAGSTYRRSAALALPQEIT